MLARPLTVLALLAAGCPANPEAEGSGESGQESGDSDASTGSDPTTGPPPMTTVAASTGGEDSTSSPADDTTGGDPSGDSTAGSSGSETGDPPPVGSPGCDAVESLAEGQHEFMLDGNDRRYIVRLPENYTADQPWPLIFALHGNGGNPDYWDTIGGDRDIRTAFADDAILIIVEAINNAWRDYDAPSETWPAGMELELAYFDAVLQIASDGLCIDLDNVFSMGFSGGGSFSGVLGCRRDYIRAIAVGGSVIYFEEEDCVETPAAWITIGDGELSDGRIAFRDFFRDLAGCQESSAPGAPRGCVDYDTCGGDTPVTFCSHPAGHTWPSIGTDATKAFFASFYDAP